MNIYSLQFRTGQFALLGKDFAEHLLQKNQKRNQQIPIQIECSNRFTSVFSPKTMNEEKKSHLT